MARNVQRRRTEPDRRKDRKQQIVQIEQKQTPEIVQNVESSGNTQNLYTFLKVSKQISESIVKIGKHQWYYSTIKGKHPTARNRAGVALISTLKSSQRRGAAQVASARKYPKRAHEQGRYHRLLVEYPTAGNHCDKATAGDGESGPKVQKATKAAGGHFARI